MNPRTLMDCAQAALTHSEEDAHIIADAAEEIERLRARVEVLRKELTDIAEYCDELDATVSTISYAARRALARTAEEAKP